jgi:glycosyltransferase involved in cell wall biosynthesis
MSKIQERLIAKQIRHWIRKMEFHNPLVITTAPERGRLAGVPRGALVYWQRDRQFESPRFGRPDWMRRRHLEVLNSADVVTGVSPTIVRDNAEVGVNSTYVPNACDLSLFNEARPEPVDLSEVARPRLIFVGTYGWRVDDDLLRAVAESRPGWSIVLICERPGGAWPRNVVHLGRKGVVEVPGYLQHGDVGVIPYRSSPFNEASCPLKLYEYLAAGLPAVVSGVEAGMATDAVLRAEGAEEWVDAVERHLSELPRRRAEARRVAAENRWEDRALRLLGLAADFRGADDGDRQSISGACSPRQYAQGHP